MIRPVQSYLSSVPHAVSVFTSETNLPRFFELDLNFDDSSFGLEYDPWHYVDSFGRQSIYKSLMRSYKTPIVTVPGQSSPNSSVVSSTGEQKEKRLSKRPKKARQFGNVTAKERKEAAEELLQCSSKN